MTERLARMVFFKPGTAWAGDEGRDRVKNFFLDAFKNGIDPQTLRALITVSEGSGRNDFL